MRRNFSKTIGLCIGNEAIDSHHAHYRSARCSRRGLDI